MSSAAARRSFLGGSDAAAVLGVSPWATRVDVYQEKALGKRREVSEEVKRRHKRGHKLEPFIREMTLDKLASLGHSVHLVGCNQRYVDPEHDFLSVEIDYEIEIDGELVNCDAKSVDGRARDKWGMVGTDEMPIEYAAQFMTGLMVAPGWRRRTLVSALRSFDDVDLYWLKRDEETVAGIREQLVRFWFDHVVPRVPPEPTNLADMRALYPKAKKPNIEATPEIMDVVARLKAIKIEKASLDAEEDELKFRLARFMGPHALLTNGVRDVLSWDTQKTKRFDLEAFKREHRDWVALYEKETTGRVMRFAKSRG